VESNHQDSEARVLEESEFNLVMTCIKECNQAIAGVSSQAHHMDTVGINSKTNMAINSQDLTKTTTETAIKNIEYEKGEKK
jgi:hypothetical protein